MSCTLYLLSQRLFFSSIKGAILLYRQYNIIFLYVIDLKKLKRFLKSC